MEMALAALLGSVVGAGLATAILVYVLQKRSDRDLIERQLRACQDYLECLGDLQSAFEGAEGDGQVLEQAWHNVAVFCREFHLTGWLLGPEMRVKLRGLVDSLEREERLFRSNGCGSGSRAAQVLCDRYHQLDRLLRGELERQGKEAHGLRLLSGKGRR